MVSESIHKNYSDLTNHRPNSKYAEWEEPPQEGEPFDYDAVPERFYFEVESAGNLEPDAIIQQGIKVLQQKLAAVIRDLTDGEAQTNGINGGGFDAPRSPDMGMNGQGWQDQGYTTPYGQNGGNAGTWGNAGAATPYGATPYGQNGQNGW
jgi:DNA-directed RNA polymerase II subunit RPB3